MLHYLLNWVFASYTDSLYAAASRIHNKGSIYYKDKVQDLVVLAYEEYDRKFHQGIVLNLPLLLNFIRYRKPEVLLDMRGYSRSPKKDIFNIRNRVEREVVLLSIDADHQPEHSYMDLIRDETNLEDEILSRIDFQTKRKGLSEQENRILQMRLDGYNVRDMVLLTGRGKGFVKTTLRNVLLKMKN